MVDYDRGVRDGFILAILFTLVLIIGFAVGTKSSSECGCECGGEVTTEGEGGTLL